MSFGQGLCVLVVWITITSSPFASCLISNCRRRKKIVDPERYCKINGENKTDTEIFIIVWKCKKFQKVRRCRNLIKSKRKPLEYSHTISITTKTVHRCILNYNLEFACQGCINADIVILKTKCNINVYVLVLHQGVPYRSIGIEKKT